VRLQTREDPAGTDVPVDVLEPPRQNPVQYFIDCLETGRSVEGPLSPEVSRVGQRIVDSAALSALHKHTVRLL
jgi:glucose-fructose oxidoreductase